MTMKNWLHKLLTLTVTASVLTVGTHKAAASDHREAPTVDAMSEGDLTDVYVFTDPNDATRAVLIMNVNPFAVAAESPSYAFSPDMLYQFKIDNTGDAREDLVIQVVFNQTGTSQTASIYGPSAPAVTGARNALLAQQPTVTGTFGTMFGSSSNMLAYVGLRDDPFVFDFAQFTRINNGTQDLFRQVGPFRGRPVRADGTSGVDSFAGFNVTTIAVSVPKSALRGATSKINVWATVSQRVPTRHGNTVYQQFERQGQQAFATIFVPKALRDPFNFDIPENDVAKYSGLVPDALTTTDNDGTGNTISGRAGLLTSLGLTTLPNGAPLLLPGTFGNTSKDLLRIALLPDVLRYDLDLPVSNFAVGQFGLQNGRLLTYSSIDAPLQILRSLADVQFPSGAGIPGGGSTARPGALQCTKYPACEDRRVLVVLQGTQFIKPDATVIDVSTVGNDRAFSTTFPYIATPHPLPGDAGTVGYPPQQ